MDLTFRGACPRFENMRIVQGDLEFEASIGKFLFLSSVLGSRQSGVQLGSGRCAIGPQAREDQGTL